VVCAGSDAGHSARGQLGERIFPDYAAVSGPIPAGGEPRRIQDLGADESGRSRRRGAYGLSGAAVGEQDREGRSHCAVNAIETSASNVSRSVEEKTLSEVPMSAQCLCAIAALAPGVRAAASCSRAAPALGTDSFQAEPGYQINAAGSARSQNEYDVDGTSVNGNRATAYANLTPEPDTIQEIRVSANSFSAEKGRNSGALVEVFTKSGTKSVSRDAQRVPTIPVSRPVRIPVTIPALATERIRIHLWVGRDQEQDVRVRSSSD